MTRWTVPAVLTWALILCLAVANGALREAVLVPRWGAHAGLMASGLLLCAAIALCAAAFVRLHAALSRRQAWTVGTLWLLLTLAFEFGFGRWVQHKAWSALLAAYTFEGGNLWPLVLLVTWVAPAVAARRRPW